VKQVEMCAPNFFRRDEQRPRVAVGGYSSGRGGGGHGAPARRADLPVDRRARSVAAFATEPVIARSPVRGFDATPGFGAVTAAVPAAAYFVRGGMVRVRTWRSGRVTHIVGIHRVHRITFWHVKHLTACVV